MLSVSNAGSIGTCHGNTQVGMYARFVRKRTGWNKMTLKEKVVETQPNKVHEHISGGIARCPWCYPYLQSCLEKDEIENQMCSHGQLDLESVNFAGIEST